MGVTAIIPSLRPGRGLKTWEAPPDYKNVIMPARENRLLPVLDKQPIIPATMKPYKYPRRNSDIRGPELIHNTLMYNQYGLIVSHVFPFTLS